jgi:tetratricopeptide (TPR) repeat protein
MSKGYLPPKVPPQQQPQQGRPSAVAPAAAVASSSSPYRRPRRRSWGAVWLTLATLVVLGGAVAAYYLLKPPPDETPLLATSTNPTPVTTNVSPGGANGGGGAGVIDIVGPTSAPVAPATQATTQSTTTETLFPPSTGPALVVNTELVDTLQAALERLVAAAQRKDGVTIGTMIDGPRVFAAVQAYGLFPGFTAAELTKRGEEFAPPSGRNIAASGIFMFDRIKVDKVLPLADPAECAVVTRATGGGKKIKYYWRMRRTGSAWRWYDFESLEGGARFIHAVLGTPAVYAANPKAPAPWGPRVAELQALAVAMWQRDTTAAVSALNSLNDARFPEPLEATRLMLNGEYVDRRAATEAAPKEALYLYDQAVVLRVDSPRIHILRARALLGLKQAKAANQAISAAQRYVDTVGEDAEAYAIIGSAYEILLRPIEAVAAFKKGLADDANSGPNQAGLKRAEAAIQKP